MGWALKQTVHDVRNLPKPHGDNEPPRKLLDGPLNPQICESELPIYDTLSSFGES